MSEAVASRQSLLFGADVVNGLVADAITGPIGGSSSAAGSFTALSAATAALTAISTAFGAVTASTTQTLAGATALKPISKITCANANDAVKLPIATGGQTVVVITVGAAATPQIFPGQAADQIDAVTAGASTTLTAAHRGAIFYSDAAGHWTSTLFGAAAT